MSQDTLIDILQANRLMRSPEEVTTFENALAELEKNPKNEYLPSLHLYKHKIRAVFTTSLGKFYDMVHRPNIAAIPLV